MQHTGWGSNPRLSPFLCSYRRTMRYALYEPYKGEALTNLATHVVIVLLPSPSCHGHHAVLLVQQRLTVTWRCLQHLHLRCASGVYCGSLGNYVNPSPPSFIHRATCTFCTTDRTPPGSNETRSTQEKQVQNDHLHAQRATCMDVFGVFDESK